MAEPRRYTALADPGRWMRWGGYAVLAACLAFIGERMWQLDWHLLGPYPGWRLIAALLAGAALFVVANTALARSWSASADPDGRLSAREVWRIYGHGVLTKYLPGSIFQYGSRHVHGGKAGLRHRGIVRSMFVEIGFHLLASMTVAGACLLAQRAPLAALAALALLAAGCLASRRPLLVALAWQLVAFAAYALAAAAVCMAILGSGADATRFAALYLFAWLAGYVVPIAPSGIGIREAALLVLAETAFPAAGVMVAILALRAASIAGDLVYGLGGQVRRSSG